MGFQGPLTAQALGRSPFDDVVQGEGEGEGEENLQDPRQQYDHRGRPTNPQSKRINRDIIRSHNEVMLVVGVAEPENPHTASDYESKRQHDAYEEGLGVRLVWATKRCVEMVGVFGINGLRQRILVYKRYSESPCWELYRAMREQGSISRDMFAGAPASLLANYIDRRFLPFWFLNIEKTLPSRCVDHVWTYIRLHLELFAAFQRLGLIRSNQHFPSFKYFLPFTEDSPIPPLPPLEDLSPQSLLTWVGAVAVSASPFIAWALMHRIMKDWQSNIWQKVIAVLPSPIFRGKGIGPLPQEPQEPHESHESQEPQEAREPAEPAPDDSQRQSMPPGTDELQAELASVELDGDDGPTSSSDDSPLPTQQPELTRRQSVYSTAGGEYGSDDDDNEVVSATLISFDVEATESTDVPQGLWSAELRPSVGPESRSAGALPIYLSTMLTRFPSLMAAKIITDSILRLAITPFEATALRLTAKVFCERRGLPSSGMFDLGMAGTVNMTWVINYLGAELTHLFLSGEIWSVFTLLSSRLHKSEEEWNDFEEKDWGDWLGPFHSSEPLF